MSNMHVVIAVVVTGVFSGCSTLTKSIEQRVSVSENCRLATSIAPIDLQSTGALASIQLGNIGVCGIDREHLLPMCAIDQILADKILTRPLGTKATPLPVSPAQANAEDKNLRTPSPESLAKEKLEKRREDDTASLAVLRFAVQALRLALHDLAIDVAAIDDDFSVVALSMRTGNYSARTTALGNIASKAIKFQGKLTTVRRAQDDLRGEVRQLDTQLVARTRAELAAWDFNLGVQLKRLEQSLAGDYQLIIEEGVKDQVLTHVARRTLELLHASLKAPDAVLRRLDDKAYGAVSIGYLAFGPNLQDAVKKAFIQIDAANDVRLRQAAQNAGKTAQGEASATAWSKPLKIELRRAACENLLQGTQFSMLTELLDTMIITHVEQTYPVRNDAKTAPPLAPPPFTGDYFITSAGAAAAPETAALPMRRTALSGSPFDMLPPPRTARPPDRVTPAGVHMTHAWTARQQLLTEAILARMHAAPADSAAALSALQQIDAVDESAVQRLADAATAKTVDDAVRLAPGLLGTGATAVSQQLSNTVNVVTAATAVSSAAVTLKVNLSVSNVNTFNPTNYNNIAPVINLPAPPSLSAAVAPALCAAGDFSRVGALCTRDGDAFVISFAGPAFPDDSCSPEDLEPALMAIGRGLADYRARYGTEHMAMIEGYASLPSARLNNCPQVARAPEAACRYVNHLRHEITVADCKEWRGNRNIALSAARASNIARVLELAGQGAVTVNRLRANGTRTAALRGGPPAADRTVVIRLEPQPLR